MHLCLETIPLKIPVQIEKPHKPEAVIEEYFIKSIEARTALIHLKVTAVEKQIRD